MRKLKTIAFWIRLIASLILLILDAASYAEVFASRDATDILSRARSLGLINLILIVLLISWIADKEWSAYQERASKPIIRVKNYGAEVKTVFTRLQTPNGVAGYKKHYDTLFVQVFNKQKNRDAKRVWAEVQWLDGAGKMVHSHKGRWHIATQTISSEPTKENLQYMDLSSNQHPETLYFAFRDKLGGDSHFYGLYRGMDGNDSWDDHNNPLDGERYTVRLILRGIDDVEQRLAYVVKHDVTALSIVEAITPDSAIDKAS